MECKWGRGIGLVTALLILLAAHPAWAGGLRSSDLAGRGGPTAASARGLLANPGTMGLIDGSSTDFDLELSLRPQAFERAESGGESFDRTRSFTVRAYPEFAHVADLGTEWFRLGFGLELPFRFSSSWPTDGAQRYHTIFHDVTAISLSPAIGFAPTDWMNVGVTLSYHLTDYRSYRAFDFGPVVAREEGVDPDSVPSEHPGNEGREYLEFTGEAFGWAAGVTFTPGEFRIGAAYHSPVDLDLSGEAKLFIPNNEFYQRRYVQDISRSAELKTRWPSEVRAGIAWAADETRGVWADVAWTHWSLVDTVEIDTDEQGGGSGPSLERETKLGWNDTLEVRVGGRFALTDVLDINGEVGFETSAIPEKRLSPEVIDASKIMGAAGVDWKIDELLSLHFGYQHVFYVPREVEQSALTPPGTGKYAAHKAIFDTGLSYRFK